MTLSALALKLILILIPGGLATLILEKLTTYLKWEPFKYIINSILLGGLSYLLSDLMFYVFYADDIKNFWLTFTSNNIPFWEIIRATGVSDKYGEENLYSYFLNSKDISEVYVRDIANNLTFYGFVDSFSENDQISEITLSKVTVYRYDDSSFLYEMPKVFLSRPKNAIFIEAPILI